MVMIIKSDNIKTNETIKDPKVCGSFKPYMVKKPKANVDWIKHYLDEQFGPSKDEYEREYWWD